MTNLTNPHDPLTQAAFGFLTIGSGAILAFEKDIKNELPGLDQDLIPSQQFTATPQGILGAAALAAGFIELGDAVDQELPAVNL